MQKMSIENKKALSGGIAPMVAWIGIMGICTLASTVASIFQQVTTNSSTNNTSGQTRNNGYANNNSAYLRVSPYPSRSAVLLGI